MDPNRQAEENYKEYTKTNGSVFLILMGATLLGVVAGPAAAVIFSGIAICLELTGRPERLLQRRLVQLFSAFVAVGVANFV